MSLPDTRDENCAPDGEVRAALLNDIQDAIIDDIDQVRGSQFLWREEFMFQGNVANGESTGSGLAVATSNGYVSGDALAPGFLCYGVASLRSTGAGAATVGLSTARLNLNGNYPFRLHFRFRIHQIADLAAMAGAGSGGFYVGLVGTGEEIGLHTGSDKAKFWIIDSDEGDVETALINTSDDTWISVEIRRYAQVLHLYVDGTEVYSQNANTTAIDEAQLVISVSDTAGGSNAEIASFDYVRLWLGS